MFENVYDSAKSYGVIIAGWAAGTMNIACDFVQQATVYLVFVGLIVRLIHDVPKAKESIHKMRAKKK